MPLSDQRSSKGDGVDSHLVERQISNYRFSFYRRYQSMDIYLTDSFKLLTIKLAIFILLNGKIATIKHGYIDAIKLSTIKLLILAQSTLLYQKVDYHTIDLRCIDSIKLSSIKQSIFVLSTLSNGRLLLILCKFAALELYQSLINLSTTKAAILNQNHGWM